MDVEPGEIIGFSRSEQYRAADSAADEYCTRLKATVLSSGGCHSDAGLSAVHVRGHGRRTPVPTSPTTSGSLSKAMAPASAFVDVPCEL
eukprot:1201396-Prymnesium_polylepis.2